MREAAGQGHERTDLAGEAVVGKDVVDRAFDHVEDLVLMTVNVQAWAVAEGVRPPRPRPTNRAVSEAPTLSYRPTFRLALTGVSLGVPFMKGRSRCDLE